MLARAKVPDGKGYTLVARPVTTVVTWQRKRFRRNYHPRTDVQSISGKRCKALAVQTLLPTAKGNGGGWRSVKVVSTDGRIGTW